MPDLRLEDHSEEVQSILGRVPKWIIRWGITVLFLLVAIVFIGSRFIPYPNTISLQVRITAQNAPAPLVNAQASNRIEKWFKNDGEIVEMGEPLAVWETNEKYEHILLIEKILQIRKNAYQFIPDTLFVPNLQPEIRAYNIALNNYNSAKKSNGYLLEIKRLENDIVSRRHHLELLNQQKSIKEREFLLRERQFKEDSMFYYKGSYGISKRDYEAELLEFLQIKSSYIQFQASMVNTNESISDLNSQILGIKDERAKNLKSLKDQLEERHFLLNQKIITWKVNHVLVAPVKGRLDRSSYWSENQLVLAGEVLAMIIPEDPLQILCRSQTDPLSVGTLRTGQRVLIKLDGFNPQEFGTVEGSILSISNVPINDQYLVKISLENGLKTMEGKEIPFIQELTGVGEVLISEGTLFQKLVQF